VLGFFLYSVSNPCPQALLHGAAARLQASELNNSIIPSKEACEIRRLMISLGVVHGEPSLSGGPWASMLQCFPIP
jgi:hypothetical protein